MKVIEDWFNDHPNLVINYVLACILENIDFLEADQKHGTFDYDTNVHECYINPTDFEKLITQLKSMGFKVSTNNTTLHIKW